MVNRCKCIHGFCQFKLPLTFVTFCEKSYSYNLRINGNDTSALVDHFFLITRTTLVTTKIQKQIMIVSLC